jgi:hypothetical protein
MEYEITQQFHQKSTINTLIISLKVTYGNILSCGMIPGPEKTSGPQEE